MKKEIEKQQLSVQEFNSTPVTIILATDSDGTVLAANKDPKIEVPPRQFVEAMREKSFERPEMAIAIISGRADGYLNKYYSDAFRPDEEGRVPKILLFSENGAFLRASTDPENLHTLIAPFTPEIKQEIVNITKVAAGEYFRTDNQNLDHKEISIWLDPKETTYGIFRRTPVDDKKREVMKSILEEITTGLERLQENNPELHINLDAVDAFLVEKVSKGMTIKDLAVGNLQQVIATAGMQTGVIQSITYHGDDVADIPAQNAINELLAEGFLAFGHTTRTNNYYPHFSPHQAELMTRTAPKSPKDPATQDTPYVLGSREVSAQEQHQHDFLDQNTIEHRNKLRVELYERGLLPSQSGDAQTPPIVVLSTGDILIQEPERYQPEVLAKLSTWTSGKVILMANGVDSASIKVKELGLGENINLIAVSPKGQVFSTDHATLDLGELMESAKLVNQIVSANAERSAEIQMLRAVQEVLVTKGFIQKTAQEQKAIAAIALADDQSLCVQESAAAASQGLSSSGAPFDVDFTALAVSPMATARTSELAKGLNGTVIEKSKKDNRKQPPRL